MQCVPRYLIPQFKYILHVASYNTGTFTPLTALSSHTPQSVWQISACASPL